MANASGPVQKGLKALILANPAASNKDIAHQIGASLRSVQYARSKLKEEGLLSTPEETKVLETVGISPELSAEDLKNMRNDPTFEEDYGDDEEIRSKLLRQVQKMAFASTSSPQTRLDATQLWVKLKDIARGKELGPGKPRTFDEAVERMARLMKACGATITLAALKTVFNLKGPANEETIEASTIEKPQEVVSPTDYESNKEED